MSETYITWISAILYNWDTQPLSDNGRTATNALNFNETKYHVKDSKQQNEDDMYFPSS